MEPTGGMRAPVIVFATPDLLETMDGKVFEQAANVARLPGIVGASIAMPDAHWGYGFPIGGVAAFDAAAGGVVSAGGVGFDISCGVRMLHTGLFTDDIRASQSWLADTLHALIPAGVGSHGSLTLSPPEMDAMLSGGARWAVEHGYGEPLDLERTEERGCVSGADPGRVSEQARERQRREVGTLASGNHYLEVQRVTAVVDSAAAAAFGLEPEGVQVSIHCGSRGLGHQIGTEFLREMTIAAEASGLDLPDRELASAPIDSPLGHRYLGAMRAGINCALANRQVLTHLTRHAFAETLPHAHLELLYDVSHNTCRTETHVVDGATRELYVHRKGATRACGPGHPDLPVPFRDVGQPVLIGGTMGTHSWVLAGNPECEGLAFGSACHGAGRRMSRNQARRTWDGRTVVRELAQQGTLVRCDSPRGIAEEAPGAYKDVDRVVAAAAEAGLARPVARLEPLICIKG
jgi:tRNA-splicing ligase RtcB